MIIRYTIHITSHICFHFSLHENTSHKESTIIKSGINKTIAAITATISEAEIGKAFFHFMSCILFSLDCLSL